MARDCQHTSAKLLLHRICYIKDSTKLDEHNDYDTKATTKHGGSRMGSKERGIEDEGDGNER